MKKKKEKKVKRPALRKTAWDKYIEQKERYDELWVDEHLLNQEKKR